jgi:hypothetical protein
MSLGEMYRGLTAVVQTVYVLKPHWLILWFKLLRRNVSCVKCLGTLLNAFKLSYFNGNIMFIAAGRIILNVYKPRA